MAELKEYIVIKEILNIRRSSTDISDDTYVGELRSGASVFLIDEPIAGALPKGGATNLWLSDHNDHFVSGDGVRPAHLSDKKENYKNIPLDYNELINVPEEVKRMKGHNVTVAVIDTGCFDHESLRGVMMRKHDVFLNNDTCVDDSGKSHGTFVSGIIAGGQSLNSKIIGVAPMVKLIVVKAVENRTTVEAKILEALRWVSKLDKDLTPDIVNMSFSISEKDMVKEFNDLFNAFSEKGITLIASGQDGVNVYQPDINFPGSGDFVYGVGSIGKAKLLKKDLHKDIDYIMPDYNFFSTENPGYGNQTGSSMASAIVTGVYALFLSYKKHSGSTGNLNAMVDRYLPQFSPDTFDDTFKLFRR